MRSRNAVVVVCAVLFGTFQFGPCLAEEQLQNKDSYLQQSSGANTPKDIDEWRKGENRGGPALYPAGPSGKPNPAGGLYRFGGSGATSFSSPDLGSEQTTFRSLVSIAVLSVSFFVILSKRYTPRDKHWAYATVGTILGYWLRG